MKSSREQLLGVLYSCLKKDIAVELWDTNKEENTCRLSIYKLSDVYNDTYTFKGSNIILADGYTRTGGKEKIARRISELVFNLMRVGQSYDQINDYFTRFKPFTNAVYQAKYAIKTTNKLDVW